jgi:hypothetical protein
LGGLIRIKKDSVILAIPHKDEDARAKYYCCQARTLSSVFFLQRIALSSFDLRESVFVTFFDVLREYGY